MRAAMCLEISIHPAQTRGYTLKSMKHAMATLKLVIAVLLGTAAGFFANDVYLYSYCDRVAQVSHLLFAYFLVPFLISFTLGTIATIIVGGRKPLAAFTKNWAVLVLSTGLSYFATMTVLWWALDAMDRIK